MKPDYKKFALMLFDATDWPDGGDLDGFGFQDAAVQCGLLTPELRYEPCGDDCSCADYYVTNDFAGGVECFRKHPDLLENKP